MSKAASSRAASKLASSRGESGRTAQLGYSEQMAAMRDEAGRRRKAAKILAVLRHVLGRDEATGLSGLTVADIGCSQGFIADELAGAGAAGTLGVDIDVPGLAVAQSRFGGRVGFVCAAGEALPLPDASVDVAVFNHIYEHVVDPEAVLADVRRVLRPDGVLYLGLGNRLGVMEPHYRLPFLSYLPQGAADRYVRAFGRADHYYEQYRTRPCGGCSPAGTWSTTRCRCWPSRARSPVTTSCRGRFRGCRSRRWRRCCRCCRRTSGSRARRRCGPAAGRCASRRERCARPTAEPRPYWAFGSGAMVRG